MKIQVTVLALLVATLAAYEAAPVEEESPPNDHLQSVVNLARRIADSASTFLDSVSSSAMVQNGREWLSSLMENVPEYLKQKKQDLTQTFQDLTGRNDQEQ